MSRPSDRSSAAIITYNCNNNGNHNIYDNNNTTINNNNNNASSGRSPALGAPRLGRGQGWGQAPEPRAPNYAK